MGVIYKQLQAHRVVMIKCLGHYVGQRRQPTKDGRAVCASLGRAGPSVIMTRKRRNKLIIFILRRGALCRKRL